MKRILLASFLVFIATNMLNACTTTTFSQQLPPGQSIAVISALGSEANFVYQPYFGSPEVCSRHLPCLDMDNAVSQTIAAKLYKTDCYSVKVLQIPCDYPISAELTPAAKAKLRALIQGKNVCKIILVTPDCMRSDPVTHTGNEGPVGYGYECATMPGDYKCAALYAGYTINIIDAYCLKIISTRSGHVVIPRVSSDLCRCNPQTISEYRLMQLFCPLKQAVIQTVKVNIQDKKLYYRD